VGRIIVVTGPPGAGKSSTADALVGLFDPSALVRGDDFFAFLRNGALAPWLEEAHAQNTAVISAAAAATGRLATHCDVVYDGVVTGHFVDTFAEEAGAAELHYALLLPPLEVCLERVRTRRGHGFTDARAAEHMWWEMSRAEVATRHVVTDPAGAPSDLAAHLATLVGSGAIRRT
jgi:cytidylate kinase